jgi:2-octaprenyl-6-methoxyphenol hydroxylase
MKTDIVVVGGGLSGFAAAVFAARTGLKVLHLAPPAPPDSRTSALMGPSVTALAASGLVPDPSAIGTALRNIRIIDATKRLMRAPEAFFESGEAGLETFGWNFSNAKLLEAFTATAAQLSNYHQSAERLASFTESQDGVTLLTENGQEIACSLLIGADGKQSLVRSLAGFDVRERRLPQSALVCDLELGRGLDGTSVEFHYPNGPFTLVPAGGNLANLVWIDTDEALAPVRALDKDALRARLMEKSQNLFGEIEPQTGVHIFPLTQFNADPVGRGRVALVGEAAHAFPPIGAQGLNLSLRDVAVLGDLLDNVDPANTDWPQEVVEAYAAARTGDLHRTSGFVNALFSSLVADMLPAQMVRAGGLWALKLLPILRKEAFSFGMGQ